MEIEKEVILLMSQGDEKAYGIMFRKFYPKVHRFVSMLLKNMDDADDVCQIIFEKIWRKRQKFAEIKDFDSYLFILAKYTVINYISTKRVIPIDIDSLPDQCANIASPHEEIAQQLGLQKKTVENHLNLALKEIKKALYLMILLQLHWV